MEKHIQQDHRVVRGRFPPRVVWGNRCLGLLEIVLRIGDWDENEKGGVFEIGKNSGHGVDIDITDDDIQDGRDN